MHTNQMGQYKCEAQCISVSVQYSTETLTCCVFCSVSVTPCRQQERDQVENSKRKAKMQEVQRNAVLEKGFTSVSRCVKR